ncbi:lipopolysaccharide biosynthesis protein, partial [Klebsiella pneumoniae]|uniref:lipopolysaccharide biosynthesis protein n=1 Tax=Klebsiella pneumoniae TaxID=573 RepID=UPI003A4DF90F
LNRLIRCVCGKKIGPDPRNFNQRVSLGRNDLLIRTFPKLTSVLVLLSIIFPLSSSAATHLALMERESKFKLISIIEVSSSLTSVIVAVIFANLGFGVYSLVAQAIVINFMSALQFWKVSKWMPSRRVFIRLADIKLIFGFSANLSLFNLINYFSRNLDSFIIGKYMSATILGSYNLAYRIMLFPLQSLTFVASRSLYPILSKDQEHNDKIKTTYYNCVFVILLITAPLMSGIALYSKPFILLVFGPQWYITADVLKWLAPTAIIQSVLSISGAVFMAKGKTDVLMRLGVIGTTLQVGAFLAGVHFSINTFALFYLIANILNFFPVMYFLLKLISGDFLSFFRQINPIIISTCGMIFLLKMIDHFVLNINNIKNFWWLAILSIIGVCIYFSFMMLLSFQFRTVIFTKLKYKAIKK